MDRIKSLLNTLIDWFTVKSARHNRAFRDLLQLSKSIEDFLVSYRLQEAVSGSTVFENRGQMRLDATELAYQTRISIRRAKFIIDKDFTLFVEEVYIALEELKRSLFTRTLSNEVLSKHISKLNTALDSLFAAISDIEYK